MTPLDEFGSELDPVKATFGVTATRLDNGDWQILLDGEPAMLVYYALFQEHAEMVARGLAAYLRRDRKLR